MADSPEEGGRQGRAPTANGAAAPKVRPDPGDVVADDESTDVKATPLPSTREGRMSLKRRITRPAFMVDLVKGSPVGEYEIEEQIGEGAMGTVFSAIHPLIGKKVAVKVLKSELCANQAQIDRFVYEAQAVNKIGHPNIVDVFSLDELPDGRAYMVMEWLRGEDLKTRLARGPMSVADACDILDGIARALDAAHAKDIVHRDLKPDNVFLHQIENGPLMVKLLDFGIAKLVRVTPGTERTQTGNMLGTPRYISPEQARGVNVDHRSDIYSLGVMAYEMLAGRPPFQGDTAMDLVVKHLNDEPPPLSQFAKVPKTLEQCVMAMLSKTPDDRPPLATVRAVLVDPTKRMTPMPQTNSGPVRVGKRRWPIVAVAGVAAIGLGAVTWKLVGGGHDAVAPPPAVAPIAPVAAVVTVADAAPVAPPAEPVVQRGTLDVTVTGSKDAVILVDGKEWGRGASITVEVDAGDHVIQVRPPNHTPISQHVTVVAGKNLPVPIVVAVAPVRAAIRAPVKKPVKPPPTNDTKDDTKHDDDLLAPKPHH